MTAIPSEDWPALIAAAHVLLAGNAITYWQGWVIHTSILFAPLAVVAFGAVRYALYGTPYPAPLVSS
jgi:hypothetical protein